MQININREKFLTAVQTVIGAIEKRQTIPVLNNILVQIQKNEAILTATDLEIELKNTIQIENYFGNFEFTLPAKKIADICKNLREYSDIKFNISNDNVIIISDNIKYNLSLLPAEDYPKTTVFSNKYSINLKKSILKGLINKVSFSMAQQDVRYYLNGMFFEINEKSISAVTTDGHRLAISTYEPEINFEENIQFILPRKTVVELQKLIDDEDEDINVEIDSNQIRFNLNKTTLTSKLIDGKFPDYKRVIPLANEKNASVNKTLLKQALIRSSIISNDKFKGAKFSFSINSLVIECQNSEKEKSREEININYNSSELAIGFNVFYILDIINVINDEEITLKLNSSESSVVIRSTEKNLTNTFVVMPMRI